VAVYDAHLVSRFEWLRHASPPDLSTPPLFMAIAARISDRDRSPLAATSSRMYWTGRTWCCRSGV
jgi:hypothetical protein